MLAIAATVLLTLAKTASVVFHCACSPASASGSPPRARKLIVRSFSVAAANAVSELLLSALRLAEFRAERPSEIREPATAAPVMNNAALGMSAIASTRGRMPDIHPLRPACLRLRVVS